MPHLGELISLIVAATWTVTAMFADKASHRFGSMAANVLRLSLAAVFLALMLWISVGHPYPVYADRNAWIWLALSALVGYVFGDWCLFNCYLFIGARFGQLFMTLAPPIAAFAGWIILGETLSWKAGLAMLVTLCGIGISIMGRDSEHHITITLPIKGILLGLGAGLGQGVGLVLSKVGMQFYSDAIPADAPAAMQTMLPFASTMIRAIIGAVGFIAMMGIQRNLSRLKVASGDAKGMGYVLIMTIFGPVLGVSLSLMAVQYTNAGIASTLMALTPVMILFPYAFIYKQKITPKEILGVTISVLGVALFFLL